MSEEITPNTLADFMRDFNMSPEDITRLGTIVSALRSKGQFKPNELSARDKEDAEIALVAKDFKKEIQSALSEVYPALDLSSPTKPLSVEAERIIAKLVYVCLQKDRASRSDQALSENLKKNIDACDRLVTFKTRLKNFLKLTREEFTDSMEEFDRLDKNFESCAAVWAMLPRTNPTSAVKLRNLRPDAESDDLDENL